MACSWRARRSRTDEAILTGESEPVAKPVDAHVYMGTTVITGRGTLRVERTGTATELGKIATSLQEHVEDDTPLQIRLKAFSGTLTRIVVGFTLAILLVGLAMGNGFLSMLRTSIILASPPCLRAAHRRDHDSGAGDAQDTKAPGPGQAPAGGGDHLAR